MINRVLLGGAKIVLRGNWQVARGLRGVFLSATGTPGTGLGSEVSADMTDFRHPITALALFLSIISPTSTLAELRVRMSSLRPEQINLDAERPGLTGNSVCGHILFQFMRSIKHACSFKIGAQTGFDDLEQTFITLVVFSTEFPAEGHVPTSAFVDMRSGGLS